MQHRQADDEPLRSGPLAGGLGVSAGVNICPDENDDDNAGGGSYWPLVAGVAGVGALGWFVMKQN